MVNISERYITIEKYKKPKMLTGFNQKVCNLVCALLYDASRSTRLPVDSANLTHSYAIRRNVAILYGALVQESDLQRSPITMQRKETGRSKCLLVMGRIGFFLIQHESVQTSSWSCTQENLENRLI